MPYLVHAEVAKPGRGTFRAEAETIRAAQEEARGLRVGAVGHARQFLGS
jgi:protein involved in polysaccharide export with SLBB domain